MKLPLRQYLSLKFCPGKTIHIFNMLLVPRILLKQFYHHMDIIGDSVDRLYYRLVSIFLYVCLLPLKVSYQSFR